MSVLLALPRFGTEDEFSKPWPTGERIMEKVTDTWVTAPRRPVSSSNQDACLVYIYPTGSAMGTRYTLNSIPVVLGRAEECEIRVTDHSVSRRHARIETRPDGYYLVDLQSTNGSFINDVRVTDTRLKDGDYLRIGTTIFRFLAGGNVEAEYHEEIHRLTIMDALTGAHNKRSLIEFLERELARSSRHARPLALLMMDVDLFKVINDEMGHLAGDFTLRELAACITSGVRREDLFARYGGEEFALVLVESTPEAAREVAERIRERVAQHPFEYEGRQFHLTVSIGVVTTPGEPGLTAQELIRRADDRLYQAKHAGRNCVVA
jgi:diguanylate cyclase (GGDEF)-like protein